MVSRAPALLALAWLLAFSACIDLTNLTGTRRPLQETVIYGSRGPKILLLEIQGPITDFERPGFIGAGTEGTVARVREHAEGLGLECVAEVESSLVGPAGNHEFFLHLRAPGVATT
jgi:hypothetical protein